MTNPYISLVDVLLVPLYFILLYGIMVYIKKKNPGNLLIQKYLLKGFVFKVMCALFYGLLITYYYGYGDSLSYFRDALFYKQLIANGTESVDFFFTSYKYTHATYNMIAGGSEGGFLVEKIALLFSYFSFSRYLVVTLIFATIAFSGMFKMLSTFAEIMPTWHKRLAIIVLFFPSINVYGSGVLKDTLCIASMGWLLYTSNQVFVKRKFSIKNIVILALSFTIVFVVKIYILAAFVFPYVIYLIMRLVKRIPNRFFRRVVLPSLLGIMLIVYISFSEFINNTLGSYSIENITETVKEQQQSYLNAEDAESGSVFDLGPMEPTISGFIKKMPAGVTAALYRPFVWESRKLIMLFSALESLCILLFTLYVIKKAGIITFCKTILNDPFVFLCLSFSLVFAALVGLSTFNFGTLARYRIPALPFYLAGLLAIWYHATIAKKKKLHENIVLSH